jgi:hypothetical protein
MLRQQIGVDARLIVEPFQIRSRNQLDQVLVPLLVFAEQHQVVVPVRGGALLVPLLRYIHLAPNHRMDAVRLRRVIKLHRSEQVAVVGHRHRRHLLFDHDLHQLVDIARAVKQRIIGMAM